MTTLMMLPDDLVLNCIARVSRSYYPILSLVCKRFRSLLVSTELYQTRTLLGCTEPCLYVCLKLPTYYSRQHWFTLCRRPTNNGCKKFLLPITCPNSPCTYQSDFARVGSKIYAIGGRLISSREATSSVMVMDCRSHTWSDAPSMLVARAAPSACVLDGKIYVTGGCENLDATNWMEAFDTKTQNWEFVSSSSTPEEKLGSGYCYQSLGFDGNVYVKLYHGRESYKMNKGRWRAADLGMAREWISSSSFCVIDNVLYGSTSGKIKWYDSRIKLWETVKGDLENLSRFPGDVTQLANYGGKLAVLWNRDKDHKSISCAVIALEKRQGGTIWGTIEWLDDVSTSEPYKVAHLVAATL
ncbi:unnamed protein product [Microthlaspi erraticum]|uniref:F-box domain-containing protein n=1 Tax=Microthlaspi erraticum TaxID=1685480 RepID=A0A6D2J3C8_9BRAS|nr:unnamed protein product [Microthlaspi erraticum]